MSEKSIFERRPKGENASEFAFAHPAPEMDEGLAKVLEAADVLEDRIKVLHHKALENEGFDISAVQSPAELHASELAATLEWLEEHKKRVREQYDGIISHIEESGRGFTPELKADRLRQPS